MNEYIEKSETNIDNLHHCFKKSWVAYFKTTSIFIIIFLLSVFFLGQKCLDGIAGFNSDYFNFYL